MTTQDNTKRAALAMLRRGSGTPSEVATLAKVTRQLMNYWLDDCGFDWRKARADRLAKEWSRRT